MGTDSRLDLAHDAEGTGVDNAEVLERRLGKIVAIVAGVEPDLVRATDVAVIGENRAVGLVDNDRAMWISAAG